MSLKPFTYPFPETRFLHAGPSVYKFKIRYGESIRGEEIEDKEVIIQELEDSIRAVLANMDNLQPFVTEHFIVFPWKPTDDSPLELIPEVRSLPEYLLKWRYYKLSLVLAEKKAEEAMVRKRRLMEEPSSPGRPGPHRAKIETSSEALSTQKPQKETKRNREGEAQQEYQDMLASDATDVQEQDSKLGHSLPELVVPPLQHSNPPPPKEPRTSGFLAFLSTLLPVRHFFRKSWQ